jgi:hypothetical protein
MTPWIVGAVLALAVGLLTSGFGLDRDRALYPVVQIVVATYYVLFAAIGASSQVLVLEVLVALAFLALAVLGFRVSLWMVAVGLAGHGVFDLFHGSVISNPGVPTWWPPFCMTYDVAAAAFLAWLLQKGRVRAAPFDTRPRGRLEPR